MTSIFAVPPRAGSGGLPSALGQPAGTQNKNAKALAPLNTKDFKYFLKNDTNFKFQFPNDLREDQLLGYLTQDTEHKTRVAGKMDNII